MYAKKEKLYRAYVSKHNSNCGKQVILLMIPNGKGHEAKSKGREANIRERWHYLAVKKLSALLRGITSSNNGDSYCLNCLYSFRAKSKSESHKRICENKDFYNVIMPFQDTKILEFNQYEKIDEIDGCKNNPESSSTIKVSEHIPSDFSMATKSSFRSIENKNDVYSGNDSRKSFVNPQESTQ